MFENVPMAPPDSILGITEAFNKDTNPRKINLSVGVYKDESGKTPILACVKAAEKKLLETEGSKSYLPIDGMPQYDKLVQEMIFAPQSPLLTAGRVATSQTPSGTAAVRVAADYLHKLFPKATVWMSDPTWPNHPQIFAAAGVATKSYPYFDKVTNGLAFEKMLAALGQIPGGDVVLLHGCCHNPSGIDPTAEQWQAIARVLAQRGVLPLVDFAYQGFGLGLQEDAAGVRALAAQCPEMLVATSYSKNFGLYSERVGSLSVVAATSQAAQAAQSQIKAVIRANYSNPPAHGGAIVATILADPALKAQWEQELAAMRNRILGMRKSFVQTLKAKGVQADFSFIARQTGMFSFSGLSKDQVERLKKEFSIYIVGNGRINVAGMTPGNMDALCTAIAAVL